MRFKSNLLDILKENVVVNCVTEGEAKIFLAELDRLGIKWRGGDSLISTSHWDTYKRDTTYRLDRLSGNDRLSYSYFGDPQLHNGQLPRVLLIKNLIYEPESELRDDLLELLNYNNVIVTGLTYYESVKFINKLISLGAEKIISLGELKKWEVDKGQTLKETTPCDDFPYNTYSYNTYYSLIDNYLLFGNVEDFQNVSIKDFKVLSYDNLIKPETEINTTPIYFRDDFVDILSKPNTVINCKNQFESNLVIQAFKYFDLRWKDDLAVSNYNHHIWPIHRDLTYYELTNEGLIYGNLRDRINIDLDIHTKTKILYFEDLLK